MNPLIMKRTKFLLHFAKPSRLSYPAIAAALMLSACSSEPVKNDRTPSTNVDSLTHEELRAAPASFERRGCCGGNGGVCGCSSGKAQCCDGSLSPRCGCD